MQTKRRKFPDRELMRRLDQHIPGFDLDSVELLLHFLAASLEIQHYIFDVLEQEHNLSEGKLMVMIILYQSPEGISPSQLADRAGVSRATISAMLQRMIRDGVAYTFLDSNDGRGKVASLTPAGKAFMEKILPGHYARITYLMNKLTREEQTQLIGLLEKIQTE